MKSKRSTRNFKRRIKQLETISCRVEAKTALLGEIIQNISRANGSKYTAIEKMREVKRYVVPQKE